MTEPVSNTSQPQSQQAAEGYEQLEASIKQQIASVAGPLFTTDADPEDLWNRYLTNIAQDRRQHYNCHCCRQFIQRFGGLVTITESGDTIPVVWNIPAPDFFLHAVNALYQYVATCKVTGVFVSNNKTWGTPVTKQWTHLSGESPYVYSGRLKTAGQVMAEKVEEHGMLCRGLADFSQEMVGQALRVLRSDTLYRSEKVLGVGEWLFNLHAQIAGKYHVLRNNLIWAAVAKAPAGFCHIRTTMISTLLEDIAAGMEFGAISRRFAEKMHPLQYQRPTAPPAEGTIKQAEELVAKMGLAPSFQRRFATLGDVQVKLWVPPASVPYQPGEKLMGGVFDHLRKTQKVAPVELPATSPMTWEKFARTVLPNILSMKINLPYDGPYYGLVTATDPTAPPIIQWDGLEGKPRNPVSWYFYHGMSTPAMWNLGGEQWGKVTAVFLSPPHWQEPEKFKHQPKNILFAIEGAQDMRMANGHTSLCLFPEILKSDLHGIRAVIEAHSHSQGITGGDISNANGLALQYNHPIPVILKVTTAEGVANYKIDRID